MEDVFVSTLIVEDCIVQFISVHQALVQPTCLLFQWWFRVLCTFSNGLNQFIADQLYATLHIKPVQLVDLSVFKSILHFLCTFTNLSSHLRTNSIRFGVHTFRPSLAAFIKLLGRATGLSLKLCLKCYFSHGVITLHIDIPQLFSLACIFICFI